MQRAYNVNKPLEDKRLNTHMFNKEISVFTENFKIAILYTPNS